MAQKTKIW